VKLPAKSLNTSSTLSATSPLHLSFYLTYYEHSTAANSIALCPPPYHQNTPYTSIIPSNKLPIKVLVQAQAQAQAPKLPSSPPLQAPKWAGSTASQNTARTTTTTAAAANMNTVNLAAAANTTDTRPPEDLRRASSVLETRSTMRRAAQASLGLVTRNIIPVGVVSSACYSHFPLLFAFFSISLDGRLGWVMAGRGLVENGC
jgi:hypothetical protein